jgi:carbon-monoxide dehydrogenase small subunit
MLHEIVLLVNSRAYTLNVESDALLIDVLRDQLGLTGTKKGCGTGDCGACTIIMDGKAVTSCMILAVSAEGKTITTIEGLEQNGKLHPIQTAFIEHGAIQCGFCTPGMILTAKTLLDSNPNPTEAEIRAGIAGNLCRCTGYTKIVEAIQAAAQAMNGGKN